MNISGQVGAVGANMIGGDNITIFCSSYEEIVSILEARRTKAGGLEAQQIIKLAERLNPKAVLDFDQALRELERAVDVTVDVIARGEQVPDEDAFVKGVLIEVGKRTKNNDFDSAAQFLDEALGELDQHEAAQRGAARRRRVAILNAGVRQHTIRRDAVAVAERIEMLVAMDHQSDRPAWLPEFRRWYDSFQADGETKGINFSLSVAAALARRMMATARGDNERGCAAILLSNTLIRLGERESGTARLEEAEEACHAALMGWTRNSAPRDWAMAQSNLGRALIRLGERESGTARLWEAVATFNRALEVRTRARAPLDWAATQHSLGIALIRVGERENGLGERSGTAQLEKAVEAFSAALEERTRERAPLDWAATQHSLGLALIRLGEWEGERARLEDAVKVFRAALEERTRERAPLDWAMTQSNLGRALTRLGEYETVQLEKAVEAFKAALDETMREHMPLGWAAIQHSLGNVLIQLGQRDNGTVQLEEAVKILKAALEERTSERALHDWAATQQSLGSALIRLGERENRAGQRESRMARLQEGIAAFDAALTVFVGTRADNCRADRDRARALLSKRNRSRFQSLLSQLFHCG